MDNATKPTEEKKSPPRKKLPTLGRPNWRKFTIPALLLLVLAIPITMYVAQQEQDLRQRAAETVCAESGTDTVLIIDKSNSMNLPADAQPTPTGINTTPTNLQPNSLSRFAKAKLAAKSFADIIEQKNVALPDGQKHKIAVVSFSNSANTTIDVWLTTDMNLVKQRIDAIVPGDNVTGSTCLECGVKKASIIFGVSGGQAPQGVPGAPQLTKESEGLFTMNTLSEDTKLFLDKASNIIAKPVYAACDGNRDCGGGQPYCVNRSCVECRNPGSGNDCNNNNVCNSNHRCVNPTPTATPTPTVTPVPPTATPTRTPTPTLTPTPAPNSTNDARPDLKNIAIILTDGKANYLDGGTQQITDTALAERKAREAIMTEYTRSNTSYYTIGLGAPTEINEGYLRTIARDTRGEYYYAPSGDDLTSIYSSIAQVIGRGSVNGYIYIDLNKNGVRDIGEGTQPEGLEGWEVKAYKGTTTEVGGTTTSDINGNYGVRGLCNGSYKVKLQTKNGYVQTFPANAGSHDVTLTSADNQITDKNFEVAQGVSTSPTIDTPILSCRPNNKVISHPSGVLTVDLTDAEQNPIGGATITWKSDPPHPDTRYREFESGTITQGLSSVIIPYDSRLSGPVNFTATYSYTDGNGNTDEVSCVHNTTFSPTTTITSGPTGTQVCSSNAECAGTSPSSPYCKSTGGATGACVECLQNSHCSNNQVCSANNQCVAPSPTGHTDDVTFLNVTMLLHGIGVAGDSQQPRPPACQRSNGNVVNLSQCFSNQNPIRFERPITLTLTNTTDNTVKTVTWDLVYDNVTGMFKGKVNLGSGWKTGNYQIRYKVPSYLGRLLGGFPVITAGEENTLRVELEGVSGDVDNDNRLSILDYNSISACYAFPGLPSTCDEEDSRATDITDDGENDEGDINLLIREMKGYSGN